MKDQQMELGIEVPDKLFFRIGEVAELVGVETHVLRYWESEFKMRPQRSKTGQRMYQRKDIAKFLRIRRLLHDEGFTIAGARKALSDGGELATSGNDDAIRDAIERLGELRKHVKSARDKLFRPLGSAN